MTMHIVMFRPVASAVASKPSPSLPSTAKMDGDAKRYEQRGVSADKGDVHAAIKTLGGKAVIEKHIIIVTLLRIEIVYQAELGHV